VDSLWKARIYGSAHAERIRIECPRDRPNPPAPFPKGNGERAVRLMLKAPWDAVALGREKIIQIRFALCALRTLRVLSALRVLISKSSLQPIQLRFALRVHRIRFAIFRNPTRGNKGSNTLSLGCGRCRLFLVKKTIQIRFKSSLQPIQLRFNPPSSPVK